MDLSKLTPEVAEEIKATQKTIQNLTEAYIIVSEPEKLIIGTLDYQTMFVWTSLEKATKFVEENLNPNEEKPVRYTLKKLLALAHRVGFSTIRFDFRAKDCPVGYQFINYNLKNGTGVLDLLATFASL